MHTSNKAYDILNMIVQVVLPGLGTLYFALAGYWDLPAPEQVVGTLTAIDLFLGGVQAWLKKNYEPPIDGKIVVDAQGRPSFQVDAALGDLTHGKQFILGVEHEKAPAA